MEAKLLLDSCMLEQADNALWQRLLGYVRSVVLRVPRWLQVEAPEVPGESWSVGQPGWVRKPEDYATQCLTVLEDGDDQTTHQAQLPGDLADLTPTKRVVSRDLASFRSPCPGPAASLGISPALD